MSKLSGYNSNHRGTTILYHKVNCPKALVVRRKTKKSSSGANSEPKNTSKGCEQGDLGLQRGRRGWIFINGWFKDRARSITNRQDTIKIWRSLLLIASDVWFLYPSLLRRPKHFVRFFLFQFINAYLSWRSSSVFGIEYRWWNIYSDLFKTPSFKMLETSWGMRHTKLKVKKRKMMNRYARTRVLTPVSKMYQMMQIRIYSKRYWKELN